MLPIEHAAAESHQPHGREMTGWLYVLACVALPCAIGLVMYVLFSAWDRARRRGSAGELPPIDYHI